MSHQFFRTGASLVLCAIAAGAAGTTEPAFRIISYLNRLGQPAGMTEGTSGVFYVISSNQPQSAFSVTGQGSKTVVGSFPSGNHIQSVLISGPDGRFYSALEAGTQPAMLFSVGSTPGSPQLFAAQNFVPVLTGNLPESEFLGVAVSDGVWHLIKSDLHGKITSIHKFPAAEHAAYTAIYASDGNYYGVSTQQGGAGYVYRVTSKGTLTKLHEFPARTFGAFGGQYIMPLLEAEDGTLYGATPDGGANGTGTIYKLTLAGQYTLLYSFPKDEASHPTTLIEGSDGNLYGAATGDLDRGGYSQLFRISKTGSYTLLYAMESLITDGGCQCQLTQASDGAIYGTAQFGGTYGGGEIFALDAHLPKPAPRVREFHPPTGQAGTKVLIWGANLLSASVEFNGVPATSVSSSGANYLWATVPAKASSGPITVTTPGGTARSAGFRVTR